MIHDLYSSLTARNRRALRWSAAATAVGLWLSTAWADPWNGVDDADDAEWY